jgi:alkylation response protein AidB-like acyl-CoA dehydrogenase
VNLSLTAEQELLRESARQALSRQWTLAAARDALEDRSAAPDLSGVMADAGWAGLLIAEDAGGVGLGIFDAMLVLEECGRVLAMVPLLGLLPAARLLDASRDPSREQTASGAIRPAYLPARPPGGHYQGWTTDPLSGYARTDAPSAQRDGDGLIINGSAAWVPDAPGADLIVGVALLDGKPVPFATEDAEVEPVMRYDSTRSMGHVTLTDSRARPLECEHQAPAFAWYDAQALLAAESLGAAQTAFEMCLAYAKERSTFGRTIGSYQAIKHELTEVLRRIENARSLGFYAAIAAEHRPAEYARAASAYRAAAGDALEFTSRANIGIHGGIGATWEHDAPLLFRRAQLSRRLLGGTPDAVDRLADEYLREARPAVSV